VPGFGLDGGPFFCSTGGNKGMADVIGTRLNRRRGVGGVGRGEQDTGSSLHIPLFFSVSTIVAAAIASFDFISDSENFVGGFYNIDKVIMKNINLKIFIYIVYLFSDV
jgi:hypothetical protein